MEEDGRRSYPTTTESTMRRQPVASDDDSPVGTRCGRSG